jgi:hypothetical protein
MAVEMRPGSSHFDAALLSPPVTSFHQCRHCNFTPARLECNPLAQPPQREGDLRADVSVARDAIVMLAQNLPWETLFDNFRKEFEERDLMASLTNLQKSVLPTLQLIHEQLKDGGDFSIEEFEQLLEGLHVPLSVLFESLLDLATQAKVVEHLEGYSLQPATAQVVDERQADDDLGLSA